MHTPMAVYRQHQKAIWSKAGMDKKLDIALTIRELLINHFTNQREDVCKLLRKAHSNICLNLIRHYQQTNQDQQVEKSKLRLLEYRPEWTLNDIEYHLSLKTQSPSTMKKVLSWGREKLSLLIPLPRIRGND